MYLTLAKYGTILRRNGLRRTLIAAGRRLASYRWRLPRRTWRPFLGLEGYFRGRHGLEIGGPSGIFRQRNLLPIYGIAARIDNCNFSARTIWGQALCPGNTYVFNNSRPSGMQFISDAVDLSCVASGSYDFLLASHVLEHIANPLRALHEWKRILTPGGFLVVVVPDKRETFDKLRPVTSLNHFRDDFEQMIAEDDLTHLPESLALTRFDLDTDSNSLDLFRMNPATRAMHHHVFLPHTLVDLLAEAGFSVISHGIAKPFHIIAICLNPNTGELSGAYADGFLT